MKADHLTVIVTENVTVTMTAEETHSGRETLDMNRHHSVVSMVITRGMVDSRETRLDRTDMVILSGRMDSHRAMVIGNRTLEVKEHRKNHLAVLVMDNIIGKVVILTEVSLALISKDGSLRISTRDMECMAGGVLKDAKIKTNGVQGAVVKRGKTSLLLLQLLHNSRLHLQMLYQLQLLTNQSVRGGGQVNGILHRTKHHLLPIQNPKIQVVMQF